MHSKPRDSVSGESGEQQGEIVGPVGVMDTPSRPKKRSAPFLEDPVRTKKTPKSSPVQEAVAKTTSPSVKSVW